MTTEIESSYDEIPYQGAAFPKTHPDSLATAARLCGLTPPDVEHCRILELGCAIGGNLIPMAAGLPGSRCLGIDLSPRQIEMGQELASAAGVDNVELRAMSILDVDEQFGEFDYIICHGVYSWVPRPVQDKILDICGKHLAPQGVAYVSYNTYPGWHLRGMIREMFRYHTLLYQNPLERVAQARAFLEFLKQAWEIRDPDHTFGRIFRDEFKELELAPDSYVFHEHLEEVNEPLYFHEFNERANKAALQYMWELDASILAGSMPYAEMQVLDKLSSDLIRREQYFDFIRDRTFRRTLLCHAGLPLIRKPEASAVTGMYVTAIVKPVSEKPDLNSTQPETFRGDPQRAEENLSATTNRPIAKRLLAALFDAFPHSLSVVELSRRVAEWRSELPPEIIADEPMADLTTVADQLLQLHLTGLAQLHVHVPQFVTPVSECPRAHPLTRQMAIQSSRVTNRRHRDIVLEDLERFLLHHLDGQHSVEDLLELVLQSITQDSAEPQPALVPNSNDGRPQLADQIRAVLCRLANLALLIS